MKYYIDSSYIYSLFEIFSATDPSDILNILSSTVEPNKINPNPDVNSIIYVTGEEGYYNFHFQFFAIWGPFCCRLCR